MNVVRGVRISIDEAMFRDLVAGLVVNAPTNVAGIEVQLALRDIGWDRMQKALDDARRRHEN
jgi:hypothetical protein